MAEETRLAVVLGVPIEGEFDHRRIPPAGVERGLGGRDIFRRRQEHQRELVLVVDAAADLLQAEQVAVEVQRRIDNEKAKFTLVFLCAEQDMHLLEKLPKTRGAPLVELTYNWDEEKYGEDRYFGHLAYEVDDIYATCANLMKMGVTINRPPRDGSMAFVRSPDLHSIELLQKGDPKPPAEPWSSMPNTGHW